MAKTPIWRHIEQALTKDIASGHYGPGDKLPTEAELSQRFGVNRHTVRRALAAMAEDGMVRSRRGAGVFVASRPTEYPIGRRTRYHQNLMAAGRLPTREILTLTSRTCDQREAEALALPPGSLVQVYETLSFADGHPLCLGRSVFPGARFANILRHFEEDPSVTNALRKCGVTDYFRHSTRLAAKAATAVQALHLRIREGAPLLRSISINVDAENQPVEYGHTWFVGERVTLTVDRDDAQTAQPAEQSA
ncbi:MAG: phosphonate metabolism transcriptional regulator PhnF [Mangrovicoccus sp.]